MERLTKTEARILTEVQALDDEYVEKPTRMTWEVLASHWRGVRGHRAALAHLAELGLVHLEPHEYLTSDAPEKTRWEDFVSLAARWEAEGGQTRIGIPHAKKRRLTPAPVASRNKKAVKPKEPAPKPTPTATVTSRNTKGKEAAMANTTLLVRLGEVGTALTKAEADREALIVEARAAGLTLRAIAAALGVTAPTVLRIERRLTS